MSATSTCPRQGLDNQRDTRGGGELSEAVEFDYVIVGAGSAGCVLANRLSADGKNSVLLLEAGPKDSNLWIHVPLGYGKLFKDKSVNWMYQTEPEPGLGGRRVFQPRGKVLGGSSSINGLLYVRGQHEDYDRWRQHGNAGWGYEDVLPYFKKAENQQRGADKYHGAGGPLPLTVAAGTSGAFFKTNPRLASPDIQIHFLPFSTDKMGEKLHSFSGFSASVCQLRPESRGSLRIKSADPVVPPEIRINYLATETDRAAFIEGLKVLRKILSAPALKPYGRRGRSGSKDFKRRGIAEFLPPDRQHGVSSDIDLPDGERSARGGRSAASPSRDRGSARGRCIYHARPDVGQYQCADHYDRRESF